MKHSFSMDLHRELLISYQGTYPVIPMYVFQPQPLYVTLNKDYYIRVDIRAYAISTLTQPLTKTNKSPLPPSLYAK